MQSCPTCPAIHEGTALLEPGLSRVLRLSCGEIVLICGHRQLEMQPAGNILKHLSGMTPGLVFGGRSPVCERSLKNWASVVTVFTAPVTNLGWFYPRPEIAVPGRSASSRITPEAQNLGQTESAFKLSHYPTQLPLYNSIAICYPDESVIRQNSSQSRPGPFSRVPPSAPMRRNAKTREEIYAAPNR